MEREEIKELKSGWAYSAKHIPTGEDWYILGIDVNGDRVCAAGWPPSIGKLSDCKDINTIDELSESEINYRKREFGTSWI